MHTLNGIKLCLAFFFFFLRNELSSFKSSASSVQGITIFLDYISSLTALLSSDATHHIIIMSDILYYCYYVRYITHRIYWIQNLKCLKICNVFRMLNFPNIWNQVMIGWVDLWKQLTDKSMHVKVLSLLLLDS